MGEEASLCGPPAWSGAVAQMGERCNRTAEVRGSIPLSSTSLKLIKSTPLRDSPTPLRARNSRFGIAIFGDVRAQLTFNQ